MDIYSIIKLICGLTFFLFGMKVMSSSLEIMAGGKLESNLKKVTSNPILSLLLGAVITIAVQSSSAVTVMLVGLVNSGIMQFSQTLFVIFGANIGTTLTSWILALSGLQSENIALNMLKPENFSPLLAFVGVIFVMFSKNDKKKNIGNVFAGFAVLMYGMVFMSDSVKPLASSPEFGDLLVKFNNPIFGVLIGTAVTAVIQSSAASIGILQALSLTGSVTYGMAIPIVMGQNIGTCATSLLSAIGAAPKAKRVAVVHFSIKVIGTVICLSVYAAVNKIFNIPLFSSATSAWGIAVIHSAFNIIITILLMPFTKLLVRLIEKLIPDKKKPAAVERPRFTLDERLLYSPGVAVNECSDYANKMCETAREMLGSSFGVLDHFDAALGERIAEQEDILDDFEDDIGSYLVKLSPYVISENDSRRVTGMLHAIGNFERLGDHALNLWETAKEIHEKNIVFSEEAKKELSRIIAALSEIISLTCDAYVNAEFDKAELVEPLEQVIDELTDKAKNNHILRLKDGVCTIEQGFVFSDMMNNFERISDHCSNIAAAVIEVKNNEFDTHKFLNAVKHGGGEFDSAFSEYEKKYGF